MNAPSDVVLTTARPDGAQASELVKRAERADGFAPLSEQFLRGLVEADLEHRHVLALENGELVGLAATDGDTAELVVAPEERRRGIGRALIGKLGEVPLWAHGDVPAARAFAAELGYRSTRELLVLALEPESPDIEPPALPEGFSAWDLPEAIRKLGREQVITQWLAVNNEAFSWHPEQGGWDRARLRDATQASWFRPGDVWFLVDHFAETIAGFHWTKWHGDPEPDVGEDSAPAGPVGEVYVIGLADAYRGRHLGDPLLEVGLSHMARRGAARVILYVESDNRAAVKAYRRRGFSPAERHVVYAPITPG